jgi:DNA polymerase III epsilon subunit-like protein
LRSGNLDLSTVFHVGTVDMILRSPSLADLAIKLLSTFYPDCPTIDETTAPHLYTPECARDYAALVAAARELRAEVVETLPFVQPAAAPKSPGAGAQPGMNPTASAWGARGPGAAASPIAVHRTPPPNPNPSGGSPAAAAAPAAAGALRRAPAPLPPTLPLAPTLFTHNSPWVRASRATSQLTTLTSHAFSTLPQCPVTTVPLTSLKATSSRWLHAVILPGAVDPAAVCVPINETGNTGVGAVMWVPLTAPPTAVLTMLGGAVAKVINALRAQGLDLSAPSPSPSPAQQGQAQQQQSTKPPGSVWGGARSGAHTPAASAGAGAAGAAAAQQPPQQPPQQQQQQQPPQQAYNPYLAANTPAGPPLPGGGAGVPATSNIEAAPRNPYPVPPAGPVYSVDVECVATGPGHNDRSPGEIALVDEKGRAVFHRYVAVDVPVVSYLTELTGLTAAKIAAAKDSEVSSLSSAIEDLRRVLPGNAVLVGSSIESDIRWLGLEAGRDFAHAVDLTKLFECYSPPMGRSPPRPVRFSLRALALRLLGMRNFQVDEHDPTIDARVSVRLYMEFARSEQAWQAATRRLRVLLPASTKIPAVIDGVCMRKFAKKECTCGQD